MRIALVTMMAVLVACSSATPPDSTVESSVAVPTIVGQTSTTATGPPATPPPFEEVAVELSADGGYLVDAEGRSLYMFALDDERTSTCEGACAEAWPPLLGDPVAGEGVDQSLLGNAERGNGSIQVTYAGHPLYLYSQDTAPGDSNGHGFNDVWFLIAPDGRPLGT